ncbi:TetR/AcrR family transcriptional regulator [Arthrobacter ginkgonis]|uniref:TetR/AcrR family transcriptional regulator n=1 Tax=Arthrobacter ginkgonis TaxID=1630594 RepID=A0ABP7BU25_9MICC
MEKNGGRPQRSAESRRRILEATLEIAAERGFEGTTMAQVSERSGLPIGSVYWHFENKDKLFAALLEYCVEAWEGSHHNWTFSPGETPAERLGQTIGVRAIEAAEPANFWRVGLLLALEQRLSGTAARETFLEIRRTRLATMTEWWQLSLPGPVLDRDPGLPLRLAQYAMAMSDGMFISGSANDGWDLAALGEMLARSLNQMAEAAIADASREPSGN